LKKLPIRTTFTLATLIMLAPAAFAQESLQDEGLHFGARLGVEHDSNVLRSSSGTVSDYAWTAGLGLRYNKEFSLQKIRADVEWDTWRYNDHSELNFNTLNYAVGWDWSITPRFHGTVSADRRQFREVTTVQLPTTPATYANLIGRRTERNELAEGGFGVSGPFRVLAGVSHYKTESSEPGSWDGSPDITFWQVGAGYEAASGSNVNFRYKRGRGDYHDDTFAGFAALNSHFRDTEEEVTARWLLTGKTTVDGRIAHVSRRHENAPALDFSGMVGSLNANWDITAKTSLRGGYMRDISATGLPTGGHVDSDRLFIAPVWHATFKTSFSLRYDHTRREWKDAAAAFPGGRTEKLDSLQAGVDWNALRTITVSGYIRQEKLSSSINAGYRANVFGVTARANF
jgi:exopolysaccharide biosynthesis operon protein EpsL